MLQAIAPKRWTICSWVNNSAYAVPTLTPLTRWNRRRPSCRSCRVADGVPSAGISAALSSVTYHPSPPGVGCETGVACDAGTGHTWVPASQTVTLVGKLSPALIFSGTDGCPLVKLTLKTPPPPSSVPHPSAPQV